MNVWPEYEAKRWPWRTVGRYRLGLARRGSERRWVAVWEWRTH